MALGTEEAYTTYIPLGLSDILHAVDVESGDEVGVSLEYDRIQGRQCTYLSRWHNDILGPTLQFTKAEVDTMLVHVQAQTGILSELDREIGRSR